METRVGINGFGRIGRMTLRAIIERGLSMEVVAINEIADPETPAYLFEYDTVHGRFDGDVELQDDRLVVNGDSIRFLKKEDPREIPWGDLGVEVVLEATGIFRRRAGGGKPGYDSHLEAGASRVVISAPAKDTPDATIVKGVNDSELSGETKCVSNASCTTHSLAPVLKVIHDRIGVRKGNISTIHAYTASQALVDTAHKKKRRSRAAAVNIIPTTTGAAKSIGLVIPELDGRLDGLAFRVPVPCGSITDLNVSLQKETTVDEVNEIMKSAAEGDMKGIIEYTEKELVSSDIIDNPHSAIFDANNTIVVDGDSLKVTAWYDNEWGYSCRTAELMDAMGSIGK